MSLRNDIDMVLLLAEAEAWSDLQRGAVARVKAALAAAQAELAKAQETIQQQARELEEADKALIDAWQEVGNWLDPRRFLLKATVKAHSTALKRHSARAQQAEVKKEDE